MVKLLFYHFDKILIHKRNFKCGNLALLCLVSSSSGPSSCQGILLAIYGTLIKMNNNHGLTHQLQIMNNNHCLIDGYKNVTWIFD
jgi:hypothetical protein